jgi:hypothetical protein
VSGRLVLIVLVRVGTRSLRHDGPYCHMEVPRPIETACPRWDWCARFVVDHSFFADHD